MRGGNRVSAHRGSNNKSSHRFAETPKANIQRSALGRSSGLTTTLNSGFLVPIWCDEGLPGDTLTVKANTFARMATPLHPIFTGQTISTFWFSVPNRLLWSKWKRFMGEQAKPSDSVDFMVPQVEQPAGGCVGQSLSDYMGIPTLVPDLAHSALWHRAYALIWNEWFRDENLQDSTGFSDGDGPDAASLYPLLRRGKRHDFFTSALPWPQKGDDVLMPLGSTAPVVSDEGFGGSGQPFFSSSPASVNTWLTGDGTATRSAGWEDGAFDGRAKWSTTHLVADLSLASSATIQDIRTAITLQQLLERDARGGTRYPEQIKSHFGVSSPDGRQQRPEYLGGGMTPINVNPVANTSGSSGDLGDLAAFVTASGMGQGFVHSFTEHCTVIGLACITANLSYQQGLPKMFSRREKYDFYFPTLANLGEQVVHNKEIYAQGSDDLAADEAAFGYQEAWAEYRYKPSQITGKMRSNDPQSLDTFHLAIDFPSLPLLNASFIEEDPPIARVIAVPSEPEWLLDVWFNVNHVRPMPVRSRPGLKRF